jgi:hypothetical protein
MDKALFCLRRSQGHLKTKGKLIHTLWHVVAEMDELKLFLMCFPVKYIKNAVILQSNKHLQVPITMQEIFVFIVKCNLAALNTKQQRDVVIFNCKITMVFVPCLLQVL